MTKDETIFIVGAGAIGRVLAALLQLDQKNVVIIRGSIDDHSEVIEKIEVDIINTKTVSANVKVSTAGNFTTLDGIVVFTNKSIGNLHLSQALAAKCRNSPIVILQNGLHVEDPFIENGFCEIYRGVLFATSQPLPANHFRFKPVEPSPIGIISGNNQTRERIVATLNNPFFKFISTPDIWPLIWTKTIVNCVFNSLCPLLETDNGIFHRDAHALNIARGIIAECVIVANQSGIPITFDDVVNKLLLISKASDGQLISTYQDILQKRESEIDSLNLAIGKAAASLNLAESVKQTKLLGELIKLKSRITRQSQY